MEDNRQKVLIYTGVAVIGLLLIGIFFSIGANNKNKKNLDSEKLASEKLLSEKLSVEKELAKVQADFSTLRLQSDSNSKMLAETNARISAQEKKINSLSGENRSLRASRNELDVLKKTKADLEKEALRLNSEYDKLLTQNQNLQKSLSSIEAEKKALTLQLENIIKANTDNFLITATRGKKTEKIVIKASRSKKLNITFEVPQNLTDAISFKLVTPAGTTIDPEDKSLSWIFPMDSRNYTASLSSVTGEFEQSRQVILSYVPKVKLVKGEYKIQVLASGNVIGNCRIALK